MNGLYQCIGIHKEIYAQQTFHIHVIANGKNFVLNRINFYLFISFFFRNKFNQNKFY